jgi:hypothetical protein
VSAAPILPLQDHSVNHFSGFSKTNVCTIYLALSRPAFALLILPYQDQCSSIFNSALSGPVCAPFILPCQDQCTIVWQVERSQILRLETIIQEVQTVKIIFFAFLTNF